MSVKTTKEQQPDTYDTLYLRSGKFMLTPEWDPQKQIDRANNTADTLLADLKLIKCELKIKKVEVK